MQYEHIASIALVVLLGVWTSSAACQVTYSFSSPHYAARSIGGGGVSQYTTAMNIEGTFTLTKPPPANFDGPIDSSMIRAWSFYDGVHHFTKANSAFRATLMTNSTGGVTGYLIGAYSPGRPQAGQRFNSLGIVCNAGTCKAVVGSDVICQQQPPEGKVCEEVGSDGKTNAAGVEVSPGSLVERPSVHSPL